MRLMLVLSLVMWAAPLAAANTVLVVGDSLSAAYNISLAEGWVALMGDRLKQADCPVSMVNAAITGETSAGGLARLPKLLERNQPSIVILELGGNDGLRGIPAVHLEENLAAMIRLSREAGARVLLLGIQIPSNYGRRYGESLAGVYPRLVELFDVPLVGFFLADVADRPELMQADGIHPNARAQPLLVDAVFPAIAPLLSDCQISQNPDLGEPYTDGP
jgi:acyl-CoA thioesterase-1